MISLIFCTIQMFPNWVSQEFWKDWEIKTEIVIFLNFNTFVVSFKRNAERKFGIWFYISLHILHKINDLNTKSQGKGVFAQESYQEIKAFQMDVNLFAKEQNIVQFPTFKSQAGVTQQSSENYNLQLLSLHAEFNRLFVDFKSKENGFILLGSNFSCNNKNINEGLHLEMIDLHADISLKQD